MYSSSAGFNKDFPSSAVFFSQSAFSKQDIFKQETEQERGQAKLVKQMAEIKGQLDGIQWLVKNTNAGVRWLMKNWEEVKGGKGRRYEDDDPCSAGFKNLSKRTLAELIVKLPIHHFHTLQALKDHLKLPGVRNIYVEYVLQHVSVSDPDNMYQVASGVCNILFTTEFLAKVYRNVTSEKEIGSMMHGQLQFSPTIPMCIYLCHFKVLTLFFRYLNALFSKKQRDVFTALLLHLNY